MTADGLCGTALRIEHVERLLQKKFNTANVIVAHKATNIGDTKGFLSDILRLELTWSRCCQRLPKTLVAKVLATGKIGKLWEEMGGEDMKKMVVNIEKLNVVKRVRGALRSNTL